MKKTLVIGSSPNPTRYSYMAVQKLLANNYEVVALGRRNGKIDNLNIQTGFPNETGIHTVTLYLNAKNQQLYYEYILNLCPMRIIFNPGAENRELMLLAKKKGIETVEACTLVMLSTGSY